MQDGVTYVGDQPELTESDDMAIVAFNLLSNGMGGIDWSGLDVVVTKLGIEDVEGLIDRFYVIKNHRPQTEGKSE